LKDFYKKMGSDKTWKDVEDHSIFSRIRAKRHGQLAHDNRDLALDQSKAAVYYEENKLRLSELKDFHEFLKGGFEQAIASRGNPVFHYALGKEREVKELKDLLVIAFQDDC
jgi:hypothetical protein